MYEHLVMLPHPALKKQSVNHLMSPALGLPGHISSPGMNGLA